MLTVVTESPPAAALELARETAAYWIASATILGFSRFISELYAKISETATPLNADELAAPNVPGRNEHYEIQTDQDVLVRLVLNIRVLPRLNELTRHQAALAAQASASENFNLIALFNKVVRWQTETAPLLVLV